MEIQRVKDLQILNQKIKDSPVVAILGPRQCGKTTLAHQFASQHPNDKIHFFDLENPRDLNKLENPMLTLERLTGFVIMDEIQRKPELFPVLRVLADSQHFTKYLILGSASRHLVSQGSESLAGRISFMELGGFSLELLGSDKWEQLWTRGGFPRFFLARDDKVSFELRQDFISTFLERDIPALGIQIPPQTLRRFWMMLAHYHGQIFNASEIGQSLGVADTTIRRYLDILSNTFMIRQLQPWLPNVKKRLVKRPKIYFRDSGLFHALLSIENLNDLSNHPKLGASWEGFAIEQIVSFLRLREEEVFFWALHTGAELDLLFFKNGKPFGIEIKYSDTPKVTQSMKSAIEDLTLEHLWVVYPGKDAYPLEEKISSVSIHHLAAITSIL
ncbi:MAG: ATP-binding protein [Chlamydiae bacterium]|nr:ATP-binding protein [Chlamydiota bacterium]MBI3276260.1 ATP-binding protein [Chlamydiota bacterium]